MNRLIIATCDIGDIVDVREPPSSDDLEDGSSKSHGALIGFGFSIGKTPTPRWYGTLLRLVSEFHSSPSYVNCENGHASDQWNEKGCHLHEESRLSFARPGQDSYLCFVDFALCAHN